MKTSNGRAALALLATTVSLLVTACGDTSAASEQGGANDPPVVSGFAYAPQPALTGNNVSFTWTVDDPDGDAVDCILDFGDGTSLAVPGCASTTRSTHTYDLDGMYAAAITADDGFGTPASGSADVAVLFSYAGAWTGNLYSVTGPFEADIQVETEGLFTTPLTFAVTSPELSDAWMDGRVTQDVIIAGVHGTFHWGSGLSPCQLEWRGTRTAGTVEGPLTLPVGASQDDPCRFLEGTIRMTKQ